MNCLLDTHTFLWALSSPEKLSRKAATLIRDPGNAVAVSIVSFWEISLKYSIGKLELQNILPDDFPDLARKMECEILTIDEQEAASFHRLPRVEHRDPFDRLIIWQAINRKLTLVSRDAKFAPYLDMGLKVVW